MHSSPPKSGDLWVGGGAQVIEEFHFLYLDVKFLIIMKTFKW